VYAVIEDSGQQFRVAVGDVLNVDLRDVKDAGGQMTFPRVLLVSEDGKVKVGTPLVVEARVQAEVVVPEFKGPKLHVYRLRRRKASRRKTGHRQKYVKVRITKIVA